MPTACDGAQVISDHCGFSSEPPLLLVVEEQLEQLIAFGWRHLRWQPSSAG
jgi:hypothetical protein